MRMLRSRRTIALVVAAVGIVAAAGALAQSKSTLIGKLEGPEVVADPAKFPRTFKEAPQLAEQVKAGKLPPVAERIGQDPLVIKPLNEVGKYGGTWRGGFTGPADFWNGFRCCQGPDHLMFWDYTGDKVMPNIARGLEMQDGGRAWLVHLRRGMKWSDGKPFTADDFVFWFEDIYRNKDLVPTPSATMAINGKQGVIEKVDTNTVRFKFPEPYVVLPLAENLEVLNLRAVAGEYDFQQRHLDLGKLPVFIENQARGNYKVYLDPGDYGGDMIIKFNLNYDADSEIAKWFSTADFRRALALGIDRDQINETFWLGTGTPSSVVPADGNKYNPGPQYRKLWATLDVRKANEMLDKIGLAKKDAHGFRLRSDGKGRLRIEIMTLGGQFVQYTQISEMIREQWKKIGIDLTVQEVERSLALKRTTANEQQLGAWNNDGSEHLFTFPTHVFPFDTIAVVASSGPLYAKWFQSAGAQGKEPPARMKELMAKFKRAYGVPADERILVG